MDRARRFVTVLHVLAAAVNLVLTAENPRPRGQGQGVAPPVQKPTTTIRPTQSGEPVAAGIDVLQSPTPPRPQNPALPFANI